MSNHNTGLAVKLNFNISKVAIAPIPNAEVLITAIFPTAFLGGMSKLGLLSAGFSAIFGREVVLQEGGAALSIHDVFRQTYEMMKPPGFRPPSPEPVHVQVHETFPIFVKYIFGYRDTFTLQVTGRQSVFQLKLQIQEISEMPPGQFDLIFGGQCLDEHGTLEDYRVQPRSTIYLALRLKGGGGPLTVSTDELAPEFDYDLTDVRDDGQVYMRGGFEYKRPYGWNRFAVRVLKRYENDDWLGPNGIRTSEASGEWPVSYHGTNMNSAEKIVKEGYKPGPGAAFGKGIYTSPSLEMVERVYAQEFPYDGKRYKIAFQNRVNPDPNGHLQIIIASQTGAGAEYWLSPKDNDDVRPYGLLLREVRPTRSQARVSPTPAAQSKQTDDTCSLM